MQYTLHATRRTPYGALRLVQAMPAWLVKTRRAPSRHSRDARVYGHSTTAMHKLSTPPPFPPIHRLLLSVISRVKRGSETPLFVLFFFSHTLLLSRQAVVTGVAPYPRFLPSIFIAHRVQQSHCSSIFHTVLLTHALALSASHFVHKKNIIPPRPSSRTSSSQLRLLGMICVLLAVRRWQVLKRAAVRMGLHQGMYGVSR